ncbi:Asp-tRNA(Asn)/Glu-tRNA(Gln) amidotransferase subunit GatC [Waterburya agarophytonicola K14]|uniref:Aspartyl/glutamyl-tRNA(Asn/Gln) amidotransferase subunit C n=1 Tax=Waterburya agarophytonicola KI4 TaxID=2874699 RepID=A0A964BUE6_9CYAN|nr:Asp-tRNA(Asn)/Glu-tRNA(Gln) amidotransferase subunit GatC [Waterburya agarophytonicola]MCC0179700.1 Asp-tRNA(Asn)/Glu-tRNA(Gln) amidotransferase subunit GatC [Waterburya agarophytonicola KI4]
MTIDREEVKKVANLARLNITEAEEEAFTTQLNSILGYFDQLSELDTTDVQPTTRAIETSNITRADELTPFPDKEELLKAAPEQQGEFFRVPKIISSDEG